MSTTHLFLGHRAARILAFLLFLVALLLLPANGIASTSRTGSSSSSIAAPNEPEGQSADAVRTIEGRHRIEFRAGYWDSGQRQTLSRVVSTGDATRVEDLLGALSYSYWVRDQLATDVTLRGLVVEATSIESAAGISESAVVVASAMFGLRLYPISSNISPLRPYLSAAMGPYIGVESQKETDGRIVEHVKTLGIFGGYLGGGLDIQMGRHLMAGVQVGYNLMADFPESIGLKRNYSGAEITAGISLLLGK